MRITTILFLWSLFAGASVIAQQDAAQPNRVSIDEAYVKDEHTIIVGLTAPFIKENLKLGTFRLEDVDTHKPVSFTLEPIEAGQSLGAGGAKTLVGGFKLTIPESEPLPLDHNYRIDIDRIEDGLRILENQTAVVDKAKATTLGIKNVTLEVENGTTFVRARFTGEFDQATMKIDGVTLGDASGNAVVLGAPKPLFETDEHGRELVFGLRFPVEQGVIEAGKSYFLSIDRIVDGKFKLSHQVLPLQALGGTLTFYRDIPNLVTAIFTTGVSPHPVVTVNRGSQSHKVGVTRMVAAGDRNQTLQLFLNEPLQHGDQVSVETTAGRGFPIEAKGTVTFKRPKDRDASTIFASGTAVAGEGQKPNLTFDFKADLGYLVPLTKSLTLGPKIDATLATSDRDQTNKLSISHNLHHVHVFGLDKLDTVPSDGSSSYDLPISALYTDLAARLEMEKGFQNRNVLSSVTVTHLRPEFFPDITFFKHSGAAFFKPSFGFDWGRNQQLEAKLKSLEGFSVARGMAKIDTGFRFEQTDSRTVSFSIVYEARYLFSEEPDTEEIPKAERTAKGDTTRTTLNDGFKGYLTASLSWKFSEPLGLELKYENGEKPVFFQDVNKVSLALTYMF